MHSSFLPIMHLLLVVVLITPVHNTADNNPSHPISLDDDPSLFPGHLEPLGSKQPKKDIEVLTAYPSPQEYFLKYIRPGRPFLLKGGAKYQKEYKVWNDDYFMSFEAAKYENVQVEPNKKERREAQGFVTSFKDFVQRYGKEKIYMVNRVPSFLQKDVMMPPPLRCKNTRNLMLDHVTWMSSGGTKSVLHQDDLDNINCLFRGEKDLLFINPIKYGSKVPIDRPKGGYSSLDVDKVNFTKFPSLREVEYINCHMEEGDCLFIPRGWYHQVNSKANAQNQNIAVNIWFRHNPRHMPEDCNLPEDEASLNHYYFPGMESLHIRDDGDGGKDDDDEDETEEEGDEEHSMLKLMMWSLTQTKYGRASFKTFTSLLKRIPNFVSDEDISHVELDENFLNVARMVFNKLNVDGNKFINGDDFKKIYQNTDQVDEIEIFVSAQMRNLQLIAASLLHQQPKSDPSMDEPPNTATRDEAPQINDEKQSAKDEL